MPVRYNDNFLIPAPFVSINKNYEKVGQKHVGTTYGITLTGKIMPCNGSPTSSGWHQTLGTYPAPESLNGQADKRLGALIKKIELLDQLFAQEGKKLEIIPIDNNTAGSMFCYPRVNSVDYPQGDVTSWFNYVDYTINLEADVILGPTVTGEGQSNDYNTGTGSGNPHEWFSNLGSSDTPYYLTEVSENWNLEFNDQAEGIMPKHAFRLTHALSATGKRHYDSTGLLREAWQNAKMWVGERLGFDANFAKVTQAFNLPSYYQGYNHIRTESTNEAVGSYDVTETWIISSGDSLEDFTVSTRSSIEDAKTVVTIEGRVEGLETRSSSNYFSVTTDKYSAANTKFNSLVSTSAFLTRSQTYSGISLNPIASDFQVQRNPVAGNVTYNYTYDNRPINCISGALIESIEVSDENYGKTVDIFASIPILGRSEGPILQDMNTTSERRRSVNIEILMPLPTGCFTSSSGITLLMSQAPRSQVNNVLNAFSSNLTTIENADQVFVERDDESWNLKTGRYTRNVVWVWQECP